MLETSSTDDCRWSAAAGGAGPQKFFQEHGYRTLQRGEAPSSLPGRGLEIWWFLAKLPNVGSEELIGG